MTTLASARQENCSTSSSSSRTRPLNDSTYGFCQGAPGSMNADSAAVKRHQSRSALAVNSGPLSQRTCAGAPRSLAEAPSLAAPLRDPQAFLAPQALHALAVDEPALLGQQCARAGIPTAAVLR